MRAKNKKRTTLRLEPELYAAAAEKAEDRDQSLNDLVAEAVAEHLRPHVEVDRAEG